MGDNHSGSLKRKLNVPLPPLHKRLKHNHKPGVVSLKRSFLKKKLSGNTVAVNADKLPWKAVQTQSIGDDDRGDILELEEVDDVEVVYKDDGRGGKVVGFRIKKPQPESITNPSISDIIKFDKPADHISIMIDEFNVDELPAWKSFPLHSALLHSLRRRGFTQPTPIQQQTLEVYLTGKSAHLNLAVSPEREDLDEKEESTEIKRHDIVGIAQTGSGKTLAYGLPVLHHILTTVSSHFSQGPKRSVSIALPPPNLRRPLQALILTPTRELALQVSEHLNACLDQIFLDQKKSINNETENQDDKGAKIKLPPPVSVAAIVGGMSVQKQRRILSRGVDVLVATPGRFWDLCGENPELALQLRSLRFLVLDEADRMIEAGHFQELDNILRLTARPSESIEDNDALPDPPIPFDIPVEEADSVKRRNDELQTFVFSATMSKNLQMDLKRNRRRRFKRKEDTSTLDDLLMKLDFRDPHPVVIDLSPKGGCIEGLQESKIECLSKDKDYYFYYFLLRHPGRSLVFLASIDGIRRLLPILELLKVNAWPLHSGLQQKQRLKNLDRFKSTKNAVLLATDVAARGLDVPLVDHVIHYQVPRSADVYVHRNGRTARAMQQGFGLVLCAPDERNVFKGVIQNLGRDEGNIPGLNVDHDLLGKLKSRVQLAQKIDGLAHRRKKETHEQNWMRETAEAMDIELNSELESDDSDDSQNIKARKDNIQLEKLKAELKDVLSQPLFARGVSAKYLTSGTRPVINDLLEGIRYADHETMLGLPKVKATSEVVRRKSKNTLSKKVA